MGADATELDLGWCHRYPSEGTHQVPQAIFFSEGLIELHRGSTDGPGISGDGIAMALAASYLNGPLATVLERPRVSIEMLTAAGDDHDGRKIRDFCITNNIGTNWFKLTKGRTASWEFVVDPNPIKKVAVVYHNRDAEHCPIDRLFRDAMSEVTGILNLIDEHTVFTVSGIAASRPFREDTFLSMLNIISDAKSRGATVIVDPNTRLRLFKNIEHARAKLTRLFRLADFVMPSFPDDLCPQGNAVFSWSTPNSTREGLFALGVSNVILKQGPDGSTWFANNGNTVAVPAPKIENPNTSGTGDAYVGAFALALTFGLTIPQAMRLGTCAAVQMARSHDRATLAPELIPTVDVIRSMVDCDAIPS